MEQFTFGIPLIGRDAAGDWGLVDTLLALTLRSLSAQGDPAFRVILAAHELPPAWAQVAGDPRFAVVRADWPVSPPSPANDDGGRKKWLIKQAVRAAGGGLLMFVDADDWVDRDLVRAARATIGPDAVGGVVTAGSAVHWPTLVARRFPMAPLYDGTFDGLCGSSTVGRVDPLGRDPVRRDPHDTLGWHGEWRATAARAGLHLPVLPVAGAYLVGTGASHSERDGPHAAWRRDFSAAIAATGEPLSSEDRWRFGQCRPAS